MNIEKQSLIKGSFEPDDAKEILCDFFRSKINYHNISAFGIHVRTGRDSLLDKNRVKELKQSLNYLNKIIKEAKKNNMKLTIICDVKIKLKKPIKAAK
ncbi:MAG: hypothetical protein ABI388_09605 [Bacteroidia bacterium]